MGFKESKGFSKLAKQLDARMREHGDDSLLLEYGTIRKDHSLVTDTFEIPIGKKEYMVCCTPEFRAGDRVLVGWIGSEVVVIDKIQKATHM